MEILGIEVYTTQQVKDFYANELSRYTTPGAKRARMTRDINAHVAWINDIKNAVNLDDGWFHGLIYTDKHIDHYEKELQCMKDIKEAIQ